MNADPVIHASRYYEAMADLAEKQAAQEWAEDRATDRAVVEITAIKKVDFSPRVASILLSRIRQRIKESGWGHTDAGVAMQESIDDACVASEG